MTSGRFDAARATANLRELVARARADLLAQGCPPTARERIVVRRTIDLRYLGQNYELEVPFDFEDFSADNVERLWADFHALHAARFGFSIPQEVIEAITLRCTLSCPNARPEFPALPARSERLEPAAVRRVVFAGGPLDTPVYARDALRAGDLIAGPALVEEAASVTVLAPHHRLEVAAAGHLLVSTADA
jgi:N-methylhydantoinase A